MRKRGEKCEKTVIGQLHVRQRLPKSNFGAEMLICMRGKLVWPASRLVGGLGREHIHGVIAWQPYHSGFLVFDLTLVRKPKRDWCDTSAETDWDHWRRPCSSGRLWALASLTRLFGFASRHPRPFVPNPAFQPGQETKEAATTPCHNSAHRRAAPVLAHTCAS